MKSALVLILALLLSVASTAQTDASPQGSLETTQTAGPRTQYEYAVVVDYYTNDKKRESYIQVSYSDGRREDASSMTQSEVLGQLGKHGWVLVSTSAIQDADSYSYWEKNTLYLRRDKR